MNAKEYLLQIADKNKEIRMQKEYIRRLNDCLTNMGIIYDKERVQGSPEYDKMSKIFGQIDEEERKLEEMKHELVDIKVKIISQIHELENDKFQDILNYVYVDGMTLKKTATEMSFSYEYIKELHGPALQAFEEKFLLHTA